MLTALFLQERHAVLTHAETEELAGAVSTRSTVPAALDSLEKFATVIHKMTQTLLF